MINLVARMSEAKSGIVTPNFATLMRATAARLSDA
jgi:hypothetical protein